MKKKTGKFVYVILIVFMGLSVALILFAKIQRDRFLMEGDADMAAFSVFMESVGQASCFFSMAVVALLRVKDRRAGKAQKLFEEQLARTPLYEQWFRGEEKQLQDTCRVGRILAAVFTVPMAGDIVFALIMLMDGSEMFGVQLLLFAFLGIWFMWWISDYRIHYMKSLLDSAAKQLPLPSDKEDFADGLLREDKGFFSYLGAAQGYASKAWVGEGYSYFRQRRNCRMMRNTDIEKVLLKKELLNVGYRGHVRPYYMMEIYIYGGQEAAWHGYFRMQEELFGAVEAFRKGGLAEEKVYSQLTD